MIFSKVPKVLIVDDQKSNRMIIKLTLKSASKYEFYEADNGEDGIKLALDKSPHIILIDAMMPKMNGFEAIKILRNNPNTMNIPILMISSLDNKDQKVQALRFGISDFISKPFDKTELITRVNSLLNLYLMFVEKRKKLKKLNKNLENKVHKAVQKKLEDVKLASIGKMIAGITHEINTPVAYMKSNLELMHYDIEDIEGNTALKESMKDTLGVLNDGLSRIQNIIDHTREISKKGKNSFNDENLYATIIFATRMIYNRAKHLMPMYINDTLFDLSIDQNFESYTRSVIKEKIEQVWIIVLNNACDEFELSKKEFSNRKMIINISTTDDNKVKIEFKDNANNGIREEILDSIFEPFVSSKVDIGMGFGLNIAKEIIEEQNGTIRAYNENEYAVFEIII
jgi:CheY-like chemotaxis protein